MMDLIKDIYYSDDYISLYIKENEELFSFEYKEDNNIFINKTIKRPILNIGDIQINDGSYDLETAYGYGGFYTNSDDEEFLDRAMKEYEQKCKDENIVAEFIRFHPFNEIPIKYGEHLDFNIYDRDVVVKELTDNMLGSYTSKVRNAVKRASEKVEIKKSENLDAFMKLYAETMKKNEASEFYFFKKEYYIQLLLNKNIELYEVLSEDKIIAMGFFMFGEKVAHYHLSANSDLSYKLNSNYALLNAIFCRAKELGLDYFMLGGGASPKEDDPLLKFKQKFSKEIRPFYISGKIYNQELYDKYNNIWKEQSKEDIKYFLKYRLEIK